MTVMILNDLVSVPIDGYSRYTEVQESKIYSHANISIHGSDQYDRIVALCEDDISSLELLVDGISIYNIRNQHGKISSINEYLDKENGTVAQSMVITFTNASGEPVNEDG